MMDLDQLFTITDYQSKSITIPWYSASTDQDDDDDEEEEATSSTMTFEILSSPAACTDFDLTGQIMWPVSNLLGHYLASKAGRHQLLLGASDGKNIPPRIVELGAGCGLPGLVTANFAEKVVLTDGNEVVMDLLQKNIDLHNIQRQQAKQSNPNNSTVSAMQVIWGDKEHLRRLLDTIGHVDHIVAADVVQWPAVLEPFLHTVKALLWTATTSQEPSLILGIVNRASTTYELFFSLAKTLGFEYRQVPASDFLENGVVPESCREFGGRQTEVYIVTLRDRSQPPILLQTTSEDMLVGKNYGQTTMLPC
jgi:hypothetical protein